MLPSTNWYVITGGPSSGKSTVIRALKDMGYKTTSELARHYIDLQRMNGRDTDEIRANQRQFQHKVLNLQVELERKLEPSKQIFFDRALPDEVAYYRYFNLEPRRANCFCTCDASQRTGKIHFGKLGLKLEFISESSHVNIYLRLDI